METDSFFYRLLKQLPQTLFELVGLPAKRALAYRFDSVELKKSYRIDGLYLPIERGLPLLFVEVQFQRVATFYANLFAKVFSYLGENDPAQQWKAVAIFANRRVEPVACGPYEVLLQSTHVQRIYLDEHPMPADASAGLAILQLVNAPLQQARELAAHILAEARRQDSGSAPAANVIELLEEMLIRRYPQFNREKVRAMFRFEDLRNTRVWQEAHEEGLEEGAILVKVKLIHMWQSEGKSAKEIAQSAENNYTRSA